MKIAIQGHPTRGKEVIQILKSLGGYTIFSGLGFNERYYYYINSNSIIEKSLITIKTKDEFKLYTLEEFEKEFPFKVGDLCIYQSEYAGDIVVKVLRMIIQDNDIVYEIGHKDTDKTYSGIYRRIDTLKPYKEMKEERNITLTLDKAKEWYKKGGELKEIALQAFTEKELTKKELPKTWNEFCREYPVHEGECWLESGDEIEQTLFSQDRKCKNWIPSKESAEAHLAMIQLEQLRDCWRQGNIPQEYKYKIRKVRNKYEIVYGIEDSFLSFCDGQTAKEFLECFKGLIEKAGDLI